MSLDDLARPSMPPAGEGRMARSWRLTRTSWRVVRGDRTLLALAACSAVLLVASTALLLGLSGGLHHPGRQTSLVLWVLLLSYPLTFANVFLGTAIAAAAAAAMRGQHLGMREALAVPAGRLGQVALWALLATGVGILLEQLASRLPFGGRLVSWVVGATWSLATLFAVPILALEGCTAPACARKSAELVKRTWGESLGGNVAITAWAVVAAIPAGMMIGIGAGMLPSARAAGEVLLVLGALVLVLVSTASTVARQTFAVALYEHARSEGDAPGPFATADLASPFVSKRGFLPPLPGRGSRGERKR